MATHTRRPLLPGVNVVGALVAGVVALSLLTVAGDVVSGVSAATLGTLTGALAVSLLLEPLVGLWANGMWYGEPSAERRPPVLVALRVAVFLAVAAGLVTLEDPFAMRVVVFGGLFVAGLVLYVEDVTEASPRLLALPLVAYAAVVLVVLADVHRVGPVLAAVAAGAVAVAHLAFTLRVR